MDSLEDYKRALEIQRRSREQAELQLEEKSRELYEKNRSLQEAMRTLNLQQQKIIAQEKYASIGQLSAGLAHEINNPNAYVISNLGALHGYIKSLVKGVQEIQAQIQSVSNVPKELVDKVDRINEDFDFEFIYEDINSLIKETENGAQRIRRITQGMQYFSNQDPKQVMPFDLSLCLQRSIELVENEEGIDVIFDTNIEPSLEYKGVLPLISQVFVNILRNAAQAKPKSGRVLVKAERRDDEVVVSIADDGAGIKVDDIGKVFDPFYTTKPKVNGLGLTISQAIVDQHNGTIDVASELGKYTEFTVHLPI